MRREALEEALCMAQLLVSLAGELVSQTPVAPKVIQDEAGFQFSWGWDFIHSCIHHYLSRYLYEINQMYIFIFDYFCIHI